MTKQSIPPGIGVCPIRELAMEERRIKINIGIKIKIEIDRNTWKYMEIHGRTRR